MSRRRRWLVLLFGTALVLATATGGFTSGRADRAVEVAVAPDADAYLGVTSESPVALSSGEHAAVALLTLHDQFAVSLTDLAVTLTEGDASATPSVTLNATPDTLDPGGSGTVTADVDCGAGGNAEDVAVAVNATGPGVSVSLSRDVAVDCSETTSGTDGGGSDATTAPGGLSVCAAGSSGPENGCSRGWNASVAVEYA